MFNGAVKPHAPFPVEIVFVQLLLVLLCDSS